MIRPTFAVTAAAAILALAAAPAVAAPKAPAPKAADWRTPDPNNVLVIETTKGRIIVELTPEAAPNHVERLRVLTRKGTYNGRAFFRVIDRFMAQTGDPTDTGEGDTDMPNLKAEFTWRRDPAGAGFVTVARPTGAEIGFLGPMPAYGQASSYSTMTTDGKVSTWGTYCPGVVGMARGDDNDSANSQFFLMRWAYPSLDKRYTAFGRVIVGLDVVRAIKAAPADDSSGKVVLPQDQMKRVRLLADIPAAERPVVRVIDTHGAWFKGEVARVRKAKGADFSACDIDIPAQVQ